ncbi:MAG: hypothetical protein NXH80_07120 [Rhodobacteraceae bacterium]|nr:hypothetical protein [Paracoccaceae bacterium]
MELFVSMMSGLLGGAIAGAMFKHIDYGALINAIVGVVGGAAGYQALKQNTPTEAPVNNLPTPSLGLDAFIDLLMAGGVGGAVLLVVYGALRNLASR